MEDVTRNVRTYEHFCQVARTLERVGDRWSLLVIRDLLTGAKRFTDLMDRLGGITPKTLSQRLRELQDTGIITADREPGRREVWYQLTPAGADLGPIIDTLNWWGLRHAWRWPLPGEPLHAEHLLRSVTQAIDLATGDHEPARWHFRLDGADYLAESDGHHWDLHRVRRRHRHHRQTQGSRTIPAADQHHGHRRTSRLVPSGPGTLQNPMFCMRVTFLQDASPSRAESAIGSLRQDGPRRAE